MVLTNYARLHFIGVGGVSMSALALLLLWSGADITGSDRNGGVFLERLSEAGAFVYVGLRPEVAAAADAVVYTSAVSDDNPELVTARKKGLPVFERHELLADIASRFGKVVAVGGTHGKTTVTAMIAHILKKLGAAMVAHVGGDAAGMGNAVVSAGSGDPIFVTEACEYKRHLLALRPHVAVVTNVECDHPDCYENLEDLRQVFSSFVSGAETAVIGEGDRDICGCAHMSIIRIESGAEYNENEVLSEGDMRICAYDVNDEVPGGQRFGLRVNGSEINDVFLPARGAHNRTDAMFAVAAVTALGFSAAAAAASLADFKGVARRYERAGKIDGAELIFDYAHHPTELRCALAVARQEGRVLTVFQPHTYSRTARYLDDFAEALKDCSPLVILPTYAAREGSERGIDSAGLADYISTKFAKSDVYTPSSFDETVDYVKNRAKEFDSVLFLGAGDIYALKDSFGAVR